MGYSVAQMKSILRAYARVKMPESRAKLLTDSEFVRLVNDVAADLNQEADIHIERYNKNGTSGETNYEMQGDILKVYYFKYVASTWQDQRYTYVGDVIVLKTAPADNETEFDIYYLRDIAKVTIDDNDEVDLPDYARREFVNLLKKRLEVDYLDVPEELYENWLRQYGIKLQQRRTNNPLDDIRTFAHGATYSESGSRYDITDKKVSQDSVAVFDTGDIEFL